MIGNVKKKLTELKESLRDEIEDIGGIKIFMLALLLTILFTPFLLVYELIIKPLYRIIRVIIDTPRLGMRKAFMKYFHSDDYQKEQWKKEREEKEALDCQLLPDSRQKKFEDWENWPDAYVVDKVAVYAAGGRTLVYVDERVTEFDVPEGVENIYHRCFACCDALKRISLPSTVKRIGKRAFFSCVSLKEISIPKSVSMIEEEMFMNCSSLEHIELHPQIKEIPARTFCHCRNLRHFKLPVELRAIRTEAFRRCYSLERIDTNEKLEIIEKKAFEDCRTLKEFIMPDTVRSCSEGMFNGCHSLQHIHFSSLIKDFGGSCCRDCWSINRFTMPKDEHMISYAKTSWEKYADKVEISTSENPIPETMFWTMGESLYFGIPRLTSVCLMFCFTKDEEYTVPSFVTNVKRDAFTSCKNLRSLRLSPYIKASDDPWDINSVSYGFIYENWTQIENIVFDETLKNTEYAVGLIG
jgi:hypothetical protein